MSEPIDLAGFEYQEAPCDKCQGSGHRISCRASICLSCCPFCEGRGRKYERVGFSKRGSK